MIYGKPPINLGIIDIEPTEMCFVQYLPIKINDKWSIPDNLSWCIPLLCRIYYNENDYVYLTIKSVYVDKNCAGRLGWHSDGFGTNDLNYIWYDSSPTEFCIQQFNLSDCDEISMEEMTDQANDGNIVTYPNKTFLMLDSGVIHRVAKSTDAGYRTFVKISISKDKYNLKGNAHNYQLDYKWDMKERMVTRNIPQNIGNYNDR